MYDPFELVDQWGPEKVVLVSDRRSGMQGVLVIDNTARGLGKGATRMSSSLTVGEVARLARTMTWKWAAVDLFHGGAKAGILGDPRTAGKERILRAFARVLANEVPSEYVFGLDMRLAEEDAAIFADELNDRGVSTAAGWAYDADGLDLAELGAAVADLGDHCVTVHSSFSPAASDLLTAPVDVLIPAAREDTVGVEVARSTTARLVVEGANLPTTEPARQLLHQRGVVVVPDFIANAGGIVAAAHSTDARYSPFVVEPTTIFPMISDKLRANTARVLRDSVARGVTPRQAAMDLAQARVLDAMMARGYRPDLDHEFRNQSAELVPA